MGRGIDSTGVTVSLSGRMAALVLLLRLRCSAGVGGFCIPPGPYGPGLIDLGGPPGPGDRERGT